jgi:hypothetical protein
MQWQVELQESELRDPRSLVGQRLDVFGHGTGLVKSFKKVIRGWDLGVT